ncbi:MAG: chemotaxis protein CheW [Syntrophomonadaceae bacterium]|jgi:purine-binding chemotaxis protein CheW
MTDEVQLVVFSLKRGQELCEYGIPITTVQEIITITNPTQLPQTPDFVEGIINLRGKIIPIVDLKKRFNMGQSELHADTRSIVVELQGRTVGIIVDEVTEVLRVPAADIEPPPQGISSVDADYLTGIGKIGNRLLVILDLEEIFSEKEKRELMKVPCEMAV